MASIPFAYECDRESGFVPDPNSRQRFGYITKLDGFGLAHPLTPDLSVFSQYSGQPKYSGITLSQPAAPTMRTATVVGVLESLNWAGGVGDAIKLEFWCSQENAATIKTLQQTTLKTTAVKSLGWWIANYDQEAKQWFEQSYPASPAAIAGLIAGKDDPELNVDLTPVPAKDGVDVNVYKVSLSVQPAANQQYALHFANSATLPTVKSWGLVTSAAPDPPA